MRKRRRFRWLAPLPYLGAGVVLSVVGLYLSIWPLLGNGYATSFVPTPSPVPEAPRTGRSFHELAEFQRVRVGLLAIWDTWAFVKSATSERRSFGVPPRVAVSRLRLGWPLRAWYIDSEGVYAFDLQFDSTASDEANEQLRARHWFPVPTYTRGTFRWWWLGVDPARLIANVVCLSLLVWVPVKLNGVVRRLSRRRRGRCQRCAYVLRELHTCPECGAAAPVPIALLSRLRRFVVCTSWHRTIVSIVITVAFLSGSAVGLAINSHSWSTTWINTQAGRPPAYLAGAWPFVGIRRVEPCVTRLFHRTQWELAQTEQDAALIAKTEGLDQSIGPRRLVVEQVAFGLPLPFASRDEGRVQGSGQTFSYPLYVDPVSRNAWHTHGFTIVPLPVRYSGPSLSWVDHRIDLRSLAINFVIVLTLVAWALEMLAWIGRARRRRRGRCANCASATQGLPLCPDCGMATTGPVGHFAPIAGRPTGGPSQQP